MKKRNLLTLIPCILLCILFLCSIPIVGLLKDTIVIMYGIQKFRTIRTCCVVGFTVSLLILAVGFKKSKIKERTITDTDVELVLKVTSSIDELKKLYSTTWYPNVPDVDKIVQDVAVVAQYYVSIGDEIKDEALVDLAETRNVLAKVLKAMLNQMSQLSRVMRVMTPRDVAQVREEAAECREGTAKLCKTSQDFVMSILDYIKDIDSGDSSDEAIIHINSFKEVVLGELDLVDKYYS